MERAPTPFAVVLAAMAAVGGCARDRTSQLVRSAGPASVEGVPTSEVHGPYVPAGDELTITLRTAISSLESLPGEPVYAVAGSTLLGTDGRVLVAPGAPVLGHVASVRGGASPQIVLAFDSVQTRLGAAPLVATVLDVQEARTPPSQVESTLLSSPSTPRPPGGVPLTSETPGVNVVALPEGTMLRLELTRAVLPPGTFVAPETNRMPSPGRER
jgi:hypothetical protein